MYPIPTPTPYAYEVTEYITALSPSDYSAWKFADDAINVWNYQPGFGQMVQVAIVIILVIAFLVILIRELQRLRDDS